MVRFTAASLILASTVVFYADAASYSGPVKVSCPEGQGSCTNAVASVNGSSQACFSSSQNTGLPTTYEVTCDTNTLTCADTCTKTGGDTSGASTTAVATSVAETPDITIPDMDMPDTPGSAPAPAQGSGGGGGNCCLAEWNTASCPAGFKGGGVVMEGNSVQTPCCLVLANGNVAGGTVSADMPSCDGFVPSGEVGGGGGGSVGGGTEGYCSAALLAQFPSCATCIYQCGGDAAHACASGFEGDCSPTCFTGGTMTTCQVESGGGGGDPFNDDASNGGTSAGALAFAGAAGVGALLLVLI